MKYQWMKKGSHLFLASTVLFSTLATTAPDMLLTAHAETATIDFKTTLKDRTTKADRLTFDIWANDKATGTQIAKEQLTVTNNGKEVPINWHDSEKTSYTLNLTTGKNVVVLTIKNGTETFKKTYTITQESAKDGDVIGDFVFSMDAFSLGTGYLIEPQRVAITKGLNNAQILDQLLKNNQFDYKSTGELTSGFYLAHITKKTPIIDKNAVRVSKDIKDLSKEMGINIDEKDYANDQSLGEFDFSRGSGWMYSVNNVFPNVGFSDSYVQDEDVMRTQFTLLYGSDLGGGMPGSKSFSGFNKDEATRALGYINSSDERQDILKDSEVKEAYEELLEEIQVVNPSQRNLDRATGQLDGAVIDWAQENENREKAYEEDYTPEQRQFLENKATYEAQIEALPAVSDMTTTDFTAFKTFKEKFDAELAPNEQKLLSNYSKLKAIVDQYQELEDDLEIVLTLQEKINALPDEKYVTLADAENVEQIRKIYDGLSAETKKKIKKISRLTDAEAKIQKLQARQTLIEDIDALPSQAAILKMDIVNKDKATYETLNAQVTKLHDAFEEIGYGKGYINSIVPSEEQYDIYNYQKLADAKIALLRLERNYAFELFKQAQKISLPRVDKQNGYHNMAEYYDEAFVKKVKTAHAFYEKVPDTMKQVYKDYALFRTSEDGHNSEALYSIITSNDFLAMQDWEKHIDTNSKALTDFFEFANTYTPTEASNENEYKKLYEYLANPQHTLQKLKEQFDDMTESEQNAFLQKYIDQYKGQAHRANIKNRYIYQLLIMCYDARKDQETLSKNEQTIQQFASMIGNYTLETTGTNQGAYEVYNWYKSVSYWNYRPYQELKKYVAEITPTQEKYMTETAKEAVTRFKDSIPDFDAKFNATKFEDYYDNALERTRLKEDLYELVDGKQRNSVEKKKYFLAVDLDDLKQYEAYIEKWWKQEIVFRNNPLFNAYINASTPNPQGNLDEFSVYASSVKYSYPGTKKQAAYNALINFAKAVRELPPLEEIDLKNKQQLMTIIETAETNYKNINNYMLEQTVMGENVTLYNAKKRLADLETVSSVEALIAKLPSLSQLSTDDKANYEAAQQAYDALDKTQQSLVTNRKTLDVASSFFNEMEAIEHVRNLMKALPTTVTTADAMNIQAIRTAYDALSENAKQFVTNYDAFVQKEATVNSLKKIEQVKALIDALPSVDKVVEADQMRIRQARQAYDELTTDEKVKINNYNVLANVEEAFDNLQAVEEKVKHVETLIGNLPTVSNVAISDKENILAARAAYEALTNTQKLRVSNIESLKRVEAQLNKLLEASGEQPIEIPEDLEENNENENETNGEDKTPADENDKAPTEDSQMTEPTTVAQLEQAIASVPSIQHVTLEDGAYIKALMTIYNKMSAEDKAKLSNSYELIVADAMYEQLKTEADKDRAKQVSSQIAALPSVSFVDLNDMQSIADARVAYDMLTNDQKHEVANYAQLTQLEQQLSNLQANARAVIAQIDALPVSNITDMHRSIIEKARQAYDALTSAQKSLVTNEQLLIEAEIQLASLQQQAVTNVIIAIDQLPETISINEQAAIVDARLAYQKLTATQQRQVGNISKLQSAETQLQSLLNVEEAVVNVVETMINELPIIVQKQDASVIQATRNAFNQLSPAQRLLVKNLTVLEEAEQRLASLTAYDEQKAAEVTALIERLPIYDSLTLEDEGQIKAARQAYNRLTTFQKQYVDIATLTEIEVALERLIQEAHAKLSVKAVKNNDTSITGTSTAGLQVAVYNGTKKLARATVAKTGQYKLKIPKQPAGTSLKVVLYNDLGKKLLAKSIVVKGVKVTGATNVKATSKKVTGKAPKNHTVKILKGTKKVAAGKTTVNGKFTIKIATQKKGTALKVVILDKKGNKSKTTTVRVK